MDYRVERGLADLKAAGLLTDIGGDWSKLPAGCALKSDSRTVGPGDIFACVVGDHVDGHRFIGQALASGVSCLLVQRPVSDVSIPWIQVKNVRAAMGFLAAALFDEPADKLKMFAVTGTQGKSTTSYMIRSILQNCGIRCGLLGTIVYDDGEKAVLADRTTPESDEVQSFLKKMTDNGCQACSMECSSHGIVQGRLSGCRFDGAVFTNLTPEHLDFHKTMENYFAAKCELFHQYLKDGAAVAPNAASEYGRRLAAEFPRAMTWALEAPARLVGENVSLSSDGGEFDLLLDGKRLARVHIPLTGRYNVENALGAAAVCLASGCDEKSVVAGLEGMPQVPGRMERLTLENGVRVIIDYAHTADSLEALLSTLRPLTRGRLVSVFGHGGDRFAGHRPLLGKAAAQKADRIFITMDNPRTEDPRAIAEQIAEGVKEVRTDDCWSIDLPRDAAIFKALDWCREGDLVALSGKGPEPYLEINGVKHPYSDRGTVEEWARRKGLQIL